MAYADGELTALEQSRIAAHLEQCGACRQAIAGMRQMSSDIGRWVVEPPPRMNPPLAAERREPRSWSRSVMASATARNGWLAAAALIVILAGGVFVGRGGRSTPVDLSATVRPQDTEAGAELLRRDAVSSAQSPTLAPAAPADAPREQAGPAPALAPGSNVIRTVSLSIVAADVDAARPAIDDILTRVSGFVGTMQIGGARNEGRTIHASLRIPSARMDEAVAALRGVGRVVDESHGGEDVTGQLVDIDARLLNNRNTEKRLTDVLQNRTGKVADILEVEREIARVRSEIERLDSQRKSMADRVSYATVSLVVAEERKATLGSGPLPLATRLRNALVDGLQSALDSATSLFLAILRIAPALLLWAALLWWPARRAYRAVRMSGGGRV